MNVDSAFPLLNIGLGHMCDHIYQCVRDTLQRLLMRAIDLCRAPIRQWQKAVRVLSVSHFVKCSFGK